eukprot:TRINITY_DN621_c0_g1_i1.p1 TRINITY_DN621_c0_g1~~TRINITY_DN621_c0_g1_i1.p1  ORF type:complete len:820 (+),score=124.06 TRINITY_DN621_c0_g1_i1:182-2641(+)
MRGFKHLNVPFPARTLQNPQQWRLERWLVQPGSRLHCEQRLAAFRSSANGALEYAYAPRSGTLVRTHLQQNSLVDATLSALACIQFCPHSVVFKGICAVCGETAQSLHFAESKNAVHRIHVAYESEQLAVSRAEAESRSSVNARHLLESRRLSLVLDLDHTLLHATDDARAPEFISCFPPNVDTQSVRAFQLGVANGHQNNCALMHVKLRPHLPDFLTRVASKFELHIYTMGTGAYAAQIANIIDPHKKLFGGRITSREDFAEGRLNQKSIQRLFPCDDSMVLIVDDREDVWISATGQSFMPNLIRAQPYHFWDGLHEVYNRAVVNYSAEGVQQAHANNEPSSANKAAAVVASEQHQNQLPGKLDAPKPSENGHEGKHTNGLLSHAETQRQRNRASGRPQPQPENAHMPQNGDRPTTAPAATGVHSAHNSKRAIESEIVQVALNSTSHAAHRSEQNGSSRHHAQHGSDKPPNDQQNKSTNCTSLDKPQAPPAASNGVIAEEVRSHCPNSVESEHNTIVPAQHQQLQNGVTEQKKGTHGACSSSANAEKMQNNKSFPGVFIDLVQKWWNKDTHPKSSRHLLRLADVLEDCHSRFFSIADETRNKGDAVRNGSPNKRFRAPADVKKILANVRRETLRDCVVSFTGVIPTGVNPSTSALWNLAQRLGAQCCVEFESGRTTHLIASEERGKNTRKYKQAVESGSAFVVTPSWLESCAFDFERQDEFEYQLDRDERFSTSDQLQSWVRANFARAALEVRPKRSVPPAADKQAADDAHLAKRRRLDSPSASVRGSGSLSPVAEGAMLSILSQDEIGAAIAAAFAE